MNGTPSCTTKSRRPPHWPARCGPLLAGGRRATPRRRRTARRKRARSAPGVSCEHSSDGVTVVRGGGVTLGEPVTYGIHEVAVCRGGFPPPLSARGELGGPPFCFFFSFPFFFPLPPPPW